MLTRSTGHRGAAPAHRRKPLKDVRKLKDAADAAIVLRCSAGRAPAKKRRVLESSIRNAMRFDGSWPEAETSVIDPQRP